MCKILILIIVGWLIIITLNLRKNNMFSLFGGDYEKIVDAYRKFVDNIKGDDTLIKTYEDNVRYYIINQSSNNLVKILPEGVSIDDVSLGVAGNDQIYLHVNNDNILIGYMLPNRKIYIAGWDESHNRSNAVFEY